MKDGKACTCIALGSSDRSISVWTMDKSRPVIILTKLFKKSVSGISWSSDGNLLLASSFDGSACFVRFGKEDLGERLSATELKEMMDNMYGRTDGALAPIPSVQLIPQKQQETQKQQQQSLLDDRIVGRSEGKNIVSSSFQNGRGTKRSYVIQEEDQGGNKRQKISQQEINSQQNGIQQNGGNQMNLRHGRALLPLQVMEDQGHVLSPIGLKEQIIQDVGQTNGQEQLQLVIKNSEVQGQQERAEVVLQRGAKDIIWKIVLKTKVLAAAGSCKFTAVATTENTLMVFSPAGRFVLNPMCISSAPVFMKANDSTGLLLLTQNADLIVWDLHQKKQTLKTTILPLIAPNYSEEINNQKQNSEPSYEDEMDEDEEYSSQIEEENSSEGDGDGERNNKIKINKNSFKRPREVVLMQNGQALVVMDNFNAYVWSEDMGVWMRIADDSHPMSILFNHVQKAAEESQITVLQRQAHEFGQHQRRKIMGSTVQRVPSSQLQDSFQHIECSMCAAECLKNQQEYISYLKSYVTYLTINQKQAKLREICGELLGPDRWIPETHTDESCWQSTVIGLHKRKLLREVVLDEILAQRKLQRLYLDVKQRLDRAENHVMQNKEQSSQNRSQLLQLLSQ
eukprot:TRINITY_DN8276_c0_g1_i1.p1 TRINITY_DN8276_c0_g1~~TRINITY_DN8276_c0_g1_i1.p1  ORF type:complete len:734 (+),score=101.17 TRINITY_DN8276_c0_g1_i1:333-2204(+)